MRGARPQWAVIKTTQIGPRCAISELKERRKAARPSPTNAATQDAAPAVRVARRACFSVCQTRAAARKIRGATSHHQKKPRPGQTRTTPPDLASRACLCPRRSTRGLPFRNNTKDKERPLVRVHTARTKKERRGRGGGAALLLEGGAERRRVPGYPSGTRARPSSSAERRMHIAERRSTKHAPGFATRETDRGRQVMRLEHGR